MRLQTSTDILVDIFKHAGLATNTNKTQTMVCVPGRIRTCQSQEVYNACVYGEGKNERYTGRRGKCDICSVGLSARSL